MKKFIRSAAREDILRQHRYLLMKEDRPLAAERFVSAIRAAIKQVCKMPGIGAPMLVRNPVLRGLRSWPVTGFTSIRVYYHVFSQDKIRIVRVLHSKQDIRKILEEESEE